MVTIFKALGSRVKLCLVFLSKNTSREQKEKCSKLRLYYVSVIIF